MDKTKALRLVAGTCLSLCLAISQFGCSYRHTEAESVVWSVSSAGDAADGSMVLSTEGITITFLSFDPDVKIGDVHEADFNFRIQNDRQDTVRIYITDWSVNGSMVNCSSSCMNFNPDEAVDRLGFMSVPYYWLRDNNISVVAETEFTVNVEKVRNVDVQATEPGEPIFSSGPIKISLSGDDHYEQVFDTGGLDIYDEGGLRIVLRSLELTENGHLVCEIFVSNTGDQGVFIKDWSCSVDGQELGELVFSGSTKWYFDDTRGVGLSDKVRVPSGKVSYSSFSTEVGQEAIDVDGAYDLSISFVVYDLDSSEMLYGIDDIPVRWPIE